MYASPKRSTLISGLVHAVAIALLILTSGVLPTPLPPADHTLLVLPKDLAKYEITRTELADGGSGGGKHDIQPATKGAPPKSTPHPRFPPGETKENLNPVLTHERSIVAT